MPPAIGLAAELVRRGHEVRVLADPTIEASARSAGCAFSPVEGSAPHQLPCRADGHDRRDGGAQPRAAFRAAKDFAGKEMTRRFAGDVVATIREFPVDAVLADGLPGILIGAQSTGLLPRRLLRRPTCGRHRACR